MIQSDRNIHMIWNDNNIPKWVYYSYNAYKKLNPTWNVILHIGLEELLDEDFQYYQLYKALYDLELQHNGRIAKLTDILRIYLIHKYGGIYVDTDTYPIKSFDDLYHINFKAKYINNWQDLFVFGCWNNREKYCLDVITENIIRYPINDNIKDVFYGFNYNPFLKYLPNFIIVMSEIQKYIDDFKNMRLKEKYIPKKLLEIYPNLEKQLYIRHFCHEMRNFNYKRIKNNI